MGSQPYYPGPTSMQGGGNSLASQYGWSGPSAYGWGGPYGAGSWGGWNQSSVPQQLGGGQMGQGLMGGASSGYPWMQYMQPFLQYLQAGMGGQPPNAVTPQPVTTPAPGAPPSLSSPHFGDMGKITGTPVAPGDQSKQYDIRQQAAAAGRPMWWGDLWTYGDRKGSPPPTAPIPGGGKPQVI